MTRLILGLGTGRCGTETLARILSTQSDVEASHEYFGPVPWDGDGQQWMVALRERQDHSPRSVLAEVAFYWLPYTHEILNSDPQAMAIVLKRPREEVIASYLKKVGLKRNHWSFEGRSQEDVWNDSYPDYPGSKEEAIGRYWDDYYERVDGLIDVFPQRVILMKTEDLNDPTVVTKVMEFVGFETPDLSLVGKRFNASE